MNASKFFIFFFIGSSMALFAQKKVEYEVAETYQKQKIVLEKKPSTLSIPFDISIDDIQNQINAGLPDLIYDDKSFEDNNADELKVKVWRKGNLIFTKVVNDVLTYEVPLKIWAQKRISVLGMSQSPATEFEIKLKFSSKFSISPDYKIITISNPEGFVWLTKPVLKTGYVEIPISPIIGKLIENKQGQFAKQIDDAIQQNFSLKPYMVEAWNMAQKPFLASQEYNTWVKIDPVEVFMTPLKAVGKSLKSALGLKIIVETLVGTPNLANPTLKSIPNLKFVNTIPDNFEVALYNVITYEEATRISKSMFVGQKYEFKNGKYVIEITDLAVYGNLNKLVLKTTTKGSFKGTIFITGIPKYDPTRKQVVLTATQIDIKTKNFLHKAASWLLEGVMESKIEKEFGLPVDEIIGFAKESVTQTINSEFSKGVRMKGEILEIKPDEVMVAENGIVATVNAKAKVELIVKGM
jgi:Domain of unknown function (DUF4403)